MSFERGNDAGENAEYGVVLSSTAFYMYENDTLGYGDAYGGVTEGFGRPFEVSIRGTSIMNEDKPL